MKYFNYRNPIFSVPTLESLISVPLVIRVPHSNAGVKILFYGFLSEIKQLRMVSLLRCVVAFGFGIVPPILELLPIVP